MVCLKARNLSACRKLCGRQAIHVDVTRSSRLASAKVRDYILRLKVINVNLVQRRARRHLQNSSPFTLCSAVWRQQILRLAGLGVGRCDLGLAWSWCKRLRWEQKQEYGNKEHAYNERERRTVLLKCHWTLNFHFTEFSTDYVKMEANLLQIRRFHAREPLALTLVSSVFQIATRNSKACFPNVSLHPPSFT